MLAAAVGRLPRWLQALVLLIVGMAFGYPSLIALGHCAWGGRCSSPGVYLIVFFASAAAFISGMVLFFVIAVKAVTSKSGSVSDSVASSPATGSAISPGAHQSRFASVVLKGQATAPNSAAAAFVVFRIAIVAVIALASVDMLRHGWPLLSSRYGRYYLLSAVLTLLLSQLPFAVALFRTWRIPDHAGLALAIVAGTLQVIATQPFFLTFMNLPVTMRSSWWLLQAMLSGVLVVLAYLAWRASGSHKGDVGLMISIFFGFMSYTVLWRITHAILSARAHLP